MGVAAERDADRCCAGSRQSEFSKRHTLWIEAPDFCRSAFAEPQIAIRAFDADVGRAVCARNLMFANLHFARRPLNQGRPFGVDRHRRSLYRDTVQAISCYSTK